MGATAAAGIYVGCRTYGTSARPSRRAYAFLDGGLRANRRFGRGRCEQVFPGEPQRRDRCVLPT